MGLVHGCKHEKHWLLSTIGGEVQDGRSHCLAAHARLFHHRWHTGQRRQVHARQVGHALGALRKSQCESQAYGFRGYHLLVARREQIASPGVFTRTGDRPAQGTQALLSRGKRPSHRPELFIVHSLAGTVQANKALEDNRPHFQPFVYGHGEVARPVGKVGLHAA